MLLISWNVAGLNTTLARIDKDFKSASLATTPEISANKRTRSHAFSYYLKRHGDPDILCIQEHKIPLKQLSSRSEPFGCSSLEGYDSFWACCVDKSKRGFNGVCTYAKSSTVQFANSRPLGCDDLDDQGRVIMTDHKYFVVFNVYAPASCGMPLSYKMRFLNALQRAMAKQRSEGKKVFLVGDLNITFSGLDIHWMSRTVKVNDIIREYTCHQKSKEDQKQSNSIPKWKVQVAQHWDAIQCALDTIEAIPVTTKNIATGNSFEKFRARVIVGKSGSERKVLLGGHEASADDCLRSFTFEEKNYLDHDLQQTILAREPNVIPLHILAELMSKIAKVDWDSPTLRLIAGTAGLMKSSPTSKWLSSILNDDKMVDAFRELFPDAQGRFTCWSQHTNRRYENDGIRIDYTIVDASMTEYFATCSPPKLRSCKYAKAEDDFGSEEAGMHAATASGLFQGASYQGGGIEQATPQALETQFGSPHTGIIYTAPQYSDHVAVSLLMNAQFDDLMPSSLILSGKETKQAQPHKSQQSISSFFGVAKTSSGVGSSSTTKNSFSKRKAMSNNEKTKKSKPRGTIMSHFAKKK